MHIFNGATPPIFTHAKWGALCIAHTVDLWYRDSDYIHVHVHVFHFTGTCQRMHCTVYLGSLWLGR